MRRALTVAFALLATAACTRPSHDGARPHPDGGLDAREAPSLTKLVEAGALPPVAERLPAEPLVVTPWERPGLYGGTWRMLVSSPNLAVYRIVGAYAPLIRWNGDASGLSPGLATRWEFNEDGTQLTLHLRKGVRWSDGAEFTSADVTYWAELTEARPERITPPFWSLVGGKPMKVTAPDAHTVVMTFAGPNWFAPQHLATAIDWADEYNLARFYFPRHYLTQFDPRYDARNADYQLFDEKNVSTKNAELPTLFPWKLVRVEDGGNRYLFERNPYYWMVDTEGRQLPYIDRIVASVVADPQLRVLKILAGDVDAQFRMLDLRDHALYLEGRKRGGYRVLRWSRGSGGSSSVILNWDDPDPVLRGILRDVRFRRALSLAIDREKCNEIAWRGLGRPQQGTISRESWHFRSPEGKAALDAWAESWARFDLAAANALLDDMGLARGKDGLRRRPDGKPLVLPYDLASSNQVGAAVDEAMIVSDGWRQLGIEVQLKSWPLGTYGLRQSLGTYTVSMNEQSEMDVFTSPDWMFPTSERHWHPGVGRWYRTGGKEGEAPTGVMKELLDVYARIQRERDVDRAHALVHEAVRLHVEHGPFALGTVADLPDLVIARENFRNVPDEPRVLGPWAVAAPASTFPETYFFDVPAAGDAK